MTRPLQAQSYWVVIPAYNEGATVRHVAARALRYCANVIVVDDGSTDDTVNVLAGLDITLLRNEQNSGKGGSLWCGFQKALSSGVRTSPGIGHRRSALRATKHIEMAVYRESRRGFLDLMGCGSPNHGQSIGIPALSCSIASGVGGEAWTATEFRVRK
jgi:cellulose synthase/poly-beta-1,6-N-acetylglucosamine synthase-like glycosyltransferase